MKSSFRRQTQNKNKNIFYMLYNTLIIIINSIVYLYYVHIKRFIRRFGVEVRILLYGVSTLIVT